MMRIFKEVKVNFYIKRKSNSRLHTTSVVVTS